MNASGPTFPAGRATLLAAAATLALAWLALDGQSLWIDELGTWRITLADSWSEWLTQFRSWPSSDAQIPLYHLYMRAWVGLFPASEIGLRMANLPWLFLGLLALLTARVRDEARGFVRLCTALVFLHPMLWYYANEARPYALIIAGACVSASGMFERLLGAGSARDIASSHRRLMAGTTLMIATSIVGAIWCVSFLIPVALPLLRDLRRRPMLTRANVIVAAVCAALLLPVAWQYASTVAAGVGATALHENTLQSFASGLYEVLGLGGIGPGREQLRDQGTAALVPFVPQIALAAGVIGAVLLAGVGAALRRDRAQALAWMLATVVPLVVFFALGTVKHWRVLGRHIVPAIFFLSMFLACGIGELWRRRGGAGQWLSRALAIAAVTALAVSSLEISHAERHRREDIREAARIAAGALREGHLTWWVALSFGAQYYNLPLTDPERCDTADARAAVKFEAPEPSALRACIEPSVIVMERPDTFDREGAVSAYLRDHAFHSIRRLQGFEIFGKGIEALPGGASTGGRR